MKGTLVKSKSGWSVRFTESTPFYIGSIVNPLHPSDVAELTKYADYSEDWVDRDVEFVLESKSGSTYAKLVDHVVDHNKIIDKDIDELKKTLEKVDYYKLGYNTAKKNLFTQEEMIEWTMCMIGQYAVGNTNIWDREILKESLPKK